MTELPLFDQQMQNDINLYSILAVFVHISSISYINILNTLLLLLFVILVVVAVDKPKRFLTNSKILQII